MSEFMQILLSGLATGSIYALAAIGFTLLWQASQTINFAQGEFVMLPAFFVLIGMQVLGLGLYPAIALALVVSIALLGVVFKRAVIQPMLPHGVLPIVMATIALAILMREMVKEFYSAEAQSFPTLFSERTFNVLGAIVSYQDVGNLVVSLVAIVALQLFLGRTRTGRCMQATAQNPAVAEILGVNIQRMVLYTFMINAALATIASVLISPIYLAKFSNGEPIGLVAFLAAIVGGFNQVRGALAGGLLIGVIDNMSAAYLSSEYRVAGPMILLIAIILLRPQGLLGTSEGQDGMTIYRNLALLVGLAILVAAPLTQGTYGTYVLCSWLIFAIAAMGLNLTLGYAGQISLAQASFMGIGAYATALITMAGLHWTLAVFAGMGLCFVVGLLLGYPALRVQHHFLAFVTLAFSTLAFLVMRNEEWLTGGVYGLVGIPRPEFGPISTAGPLAYYYFTLIVFLIGFAGFYGIVRSPWGRAFKALRENPIRANSLGVDTRLITLLAFAIGAAYGGLSGALMAPLVQYIDPMSFTLLISLKILLMVVVGGSGYFLGPLLGAGLVIMLPEFLRFAESYYLMIYAGLVILLMVFCPTGLIGLFDRTVTLFRERRVERGDLKEGAQL